MPRINSPGFRFVANINRLHFMMPILFTIMISLLLAYFTLFSTFNGANSPLLFDGIDEFFVALNITVLAVVSTTSLFIFFRLFREKPELAVKILVATFILSGILSTLLFAKLLFTSLGLESPLILIIVALVTYMGAYFAYLVIVDALSDRMKNLLFVVCSGALGSFVGVLVPTPPIIVISLFLAIADLVLIKRKTVEKFAGEATYEKLIVGIAFSSREWGIGIGDLTCYSIVVANTSLNFGIPAGGSSLLMIMIGSFLSLAIAVKRARVPGLPISIALGLLPSIMLSFFL